jgi:hypothetical protein
MHLNGKRFYVLHAQLLIGLCSFLRGFPCSGSRQHVYPMMLRYNMPGCVAL